MESATRKLFLSFSDGCFLAQQKLSVFAPAILWSGFKNGSLLIPVPERFFSLLTAAPHVCRPILRPLSGYDERGFGKQDWIGSLARMNENGSCGHVPTEFLLVLTQCHCALDALN